MGFFKRRTAAQEMPRAESIILNGSEFVDPVIRTCSAATDQILTDLLVSGMADRLYIQRILAADAERQFPGHRDEVNRLRAQHGLPPL